MQHDTTARYLADKALAELEQFRSRLRQSVHSQTTALSAALLRQFPGALAVTINGAALSADTMPEMWTGTVHRLHVFAKEVGTDTSLLLLSHTLLDQTSRRHADGHPFGWTCSVRQELYAADLTTLSDREIAVTYADALGDKPFPVKLAEAATEFHEAMNAGRFDLGLGCPSGDDSRACETPCDTSCPRSQSAMAAVWVNPAGEAGQAAERLKASQLRTHQKPAPGSAGSPSIAGRPARAGLVKAARDGRLRKPAPGGGCASCPSRTFHR